MPNDYYLTTSYVREYEGLADLPDNPLNLLALGNALVGAALLHHYRSVDPNDLANNITLPSTDPKSVYVLVPTPRLPILMVLDGVVPEPILAGLDPALRWGVDLGYDRTTPANVPTPFTLLPTFNPVTAASALPKAIADGVDAAASAANLHLRLHCNRNRSHCNRIPHKCNRRPRSPPHQSGPDRCRYARVAEVRSDKRPSAPGRAARVR